MVMVRSLLLFALISLSLPGCAAEEKKAKEEPQKTAPILVFEQRPKVLSPDQRAALGFPPEIIERVETAAGSGVEPFYESLFAPTENLRGDTGIERMRLAGFSVRTPRADRIIEHLTRPLRSEGFLIFRSEQNFGSVPDVVTVIRGNSSYDILKMQRTEAPQYRLTTDKIISWLKERQKEGSFIVVGAGPDWLETRFVKPPKDPDQFARKVVSFAPDVGRRYGGRLSRVTAQMKKVNGFYLWWE